MAEKEISTASVMSNVGWDALTQYPPQLPRNLTCTCIYYHSILSNVTTQTRVSLYTILRYPRNGTSSFLIHI